MKKISKICILIFLMLFIFSNICNATSYKNEDIIKESEIENKKIAKTLDELKEEGSLETFWNIVGDTIEDKFTEPEKNKDKIKGPLQDPISNPNFYEPKDNTGENTEFIKLGNIVIGTMQAVGTVIAVISLMVIGLKYMFASTAEKASYKETMIPYIIGAIMLFAIPTIVNIIYTLVKGIKL